MTITIMEACDQVLNHLAVLLRDTKQLALHGKVPNWLKQRAIRKLYRLYRQRSKFCIDEFGENDIFVSAASSSLSAAAQREREQNAVNAAGPGTRMDENDNHLTLHLKGSELQIAPKCPKYISAGEEVQLHKLLGSGGFGSVYQGTVGGVNVAVKRLHANTNNTQARLESFRAELSILNLENHPNVVQTLATLTDADLAGDSWVIMEYAGSRNLQQVINDPTEGMPASRRVRYAMDLARALVFAHSQLLVHLDVKPANILITDEDKCKLGDFGCCQTLASEGGSIVGRSTLMGTFAYRAPELLKGAAPTAKADIYALGITLWQMLARETPYGNENQHVVIFGVVAYNLRPSLPAIEDPTDYLDLCYRDLLVQCWDADTSIRPTAADLAEVFQVWHTYM